MASQRLTVATLTGATAKAVTTLFAGWRSAPDPIAVDGFCTALRDNALSPVVVYFAEWIDRWLMGDLVPGPGAVEGQRFIASLITPDQATEWVGRCGDQHREQVWLAAQLRAAATGWEWVADRLAVVLVREVTGPSATDEELRAAAGAAPAWLSQSISSELLRP